MTKNNKLSWLISLLTLGIVLGGSVQSSEQEAFVIKGDSSSWDIPNSQMKYFGNAIFRYQNLTLEGNELIAQKAANGNNNVIEVNGEPAYFSDSQIGSEQFTKLSAKNIRYLVDEKTIKAKTQVHLQQQNERNESVDIKGDSLEIVQADNYRLLVTGKPVTIAIKRLEQEPIKAEAGQINYDKNKEEFEMIGTVVLRSSRETMRADKVIFNMKTGILEVPKSPTSQVEIIQSQIKKP